MHLNCPNCRFPIESNDVNLVKTIAKCKSCNNIFDFSEKLEKNELPARYRKEIVIPPGIEVLHLMNELEIMIKWRKSAKCMFTLFFALIWNAFISFMLVLIMGFGAASITVLLFFIPFIFAGVYLLYSSIGHLVNTTYITVDEYRLSIEHKPLNFLIQKDRHYLPEEIEQVFVRKYSNGSTNGKPVYAYAVDLKIKDGKTKTLVKELHAADYARYIEQEIEYFLKIKDRPVEGEYSFGID